MVLRAERNPSESEAGGYHYKEYLENYVPRKIRALWRETGCQQVGRFGLKELRFHL